MDSHPHHLSDQYFLKFRDMRDISQFFTSCYISCARFFLLKERSNAGYYTKHDCQVSQPSNET